MELAQLSESLLQRARQLSSATLHEAAGRVGALPGTIRPIAAGVRLCGPAMPVHCLPGDNLWLHNAIYCARPGEVLVVSSPAAEFGYWGEVMAVAAQCRQIAGLVIDAGVRDAERMAALRFPVFSRGICIQGTRKDVAGSGAIGELIRIGNVEIERGDLVVGDADGVVVIPWAAAADAVAGAEQRDRDEQTIFDRLRNGESTLAIFDLPARGPNPLSFTSR